MSQWFISHVALAEDPGSVINMNITVKNVAAFWPCLKSLPEANVKFWINFVTEEISKQSNIDTVVWLLVVTLMKVDNEKEQAEQGKLENVKYEEKKKHREWIGVKTCAQEDKQEIV